MPTSPPASFTAPSLARAAYHAGWLHRLPYPLRTTLRRWRGMLGMILGVWWVVSGLVDVIGAIVSPGAGGRGWEIAAGVVTMLAGGFLLVYTDLSLKVLTVFVSIWLILAGAMATAAAFRLRSERAPS